MSRSIPDRWLAYEPHGALIDGTNILAFKVPLKEAITRNLPSSQQFTPAMLMRKFPKLKFIVDLTNTNRYYYPKDFQNAGIKYIKIMISRKEVPGIEGVKKFYKAMEFFKSAAKNGELIGVHCTHGINRTGYLICRYLVQQLGWEPQKSVKAFEKARGYSIERAAYVTELMKVPRTKLDVKNVPLENSDGSKYHQKRHLMMPGPMGPSKFDHRPRFMNDRAYPPPRPHQPFSYGGPSPPPRAFGPRSPIIPPIPPPPPGRWLEGPRPHAYGMLPIRPPGPGPFPGSRYAPRMPGPPGMPGPPRLPPPNIGPPFRLSGPGMPPPRLPPPGMAPPRLPPPGMGLNRLPPPGMGLNRLPPPGMGAPRLPPPGMALPRMPPPGMAPPRMPPPRLSNVRRSLELLRRELPPARGPFEQRDKSATLKTITKKWVITVDTVSGRILRQQTVVARFWTDSP